MPVVFFRHIGANLAYIHSVEGVDPGFGVGGGVDPGYGHPDWSGNRPDNSLPGGGHISNRPPGSFPGYPGHALPGSPGSPGNELPSNPPPQVAAGLTLILIRKDGKWKYAALDPSMTPEPLPEPTPEPKPV